MNDGWIVITVIIGTVLAYLFARWLYKRIYTPLLLPIAVATGVIILFLVIFNISYETYMIGGKWIHLLLGPAVVSLAYPLYQQRDVLRQLALPILIGTFVGAVIGVATGIILARVFRIEDALLYSLLPKSVTTPVAMDISESLGGIGSLAAVFVMIAGITGAMVSRHIFTLFRMDSKVGRGVGLGSASHAIGTARALESSQLEGSISTIAMIVSAIFVSLITPILVQILM